ncbi:ABC transporter ATP-binding protein [Streptomyces sp. NPDC126497]|uniref:ABC transporter ATP-binding protein n=1 Tax=Streptomyces sp. NPDC126497 TaxID=3155313 RepID=UPI00332D5D34
MCKRRRHGLAHPRRPGGCRRSGHHPCPDRPAGHHPGALHERLALEWQHLADARIFHRKDAPVLICDEPTSALDRRAEEAVYDRIRTLSEGRTVILITHRLGSTRAAHRILVLDGGRLLEEGTHNTLLAVGGEYATLRRTQVQTYADQPQR